MWPIEIEFVIENINIVEVEKQTCEHSIFKCRKKYMHQTQKGSENKYHNWEVLTTFKNDFRLDQKPYLVENAKFCLFALSVNVNIFAKFSES